MKNAEMMEVVGTDRAKKTFYSTPKSLADELISGYDWNYIESILEPSAGKGDLAFAAAKRLPSEWAILCTMKEMNARP